MKIIQKIAAILYSVWAAYRSYVLILAVVYSSSTVTVTTEGVQYFSQIDVFSFLILLLSLSLIASSIFILCNSFIKKYSLKREISSIVWLGINSSLIFLLPPMTYLIAEAIILEPLYNFCTDKVIFIISIILSKYVLITFALFIIIITSLKIGGVGREKV